MACYLQFPATTLPTYPVAPVRNTFIMPPISYGLFGSGTTVYRRAGCASSAFMSMCFGFHPSTRRAFSLDDWLFEAQYFDIKGPSAFPSSASPSSATSPSSPRPRLRASAMAFVRRPLSAPAWKIPPGHPPQVRERRGQQDRQHGRRTRDGLHFQLHKAQLPEPELSSSSSVLAVSRGRKVRLSS